MMKQNIEKLAGMNFEIDKDKFKKFGKIYYK